MISVRSAVVAPPSFGVHTGLRVIRVLWQRNVTNRVEAVALSVLWSTSELF